jgi:hypothetical protein
MNNLDLDDFICSVRGDCRTPSVFRCACRWKFCISCYNACCKTCECCNIVMCVNCHADHTFPIVIKGEENENPTNSGQSIFHWF